MRRLDPRAGLLILCLAPAASHAQTDPFDTAMEEALSDAGTASSLIRCTSLFRAFRIYAGEDTQVGATAAMRETDLAVASVVIWQNETGESELEAAFAVIVPMVGAATDLYLARMGDNQDALGTVFDDALETELTFCGTLHGEITAQTGE